MAGNNLRQAKSPPAPKITMMVWVGFAVVSIFFI